MDNVEAMSRTLDPSQPWVKDSRGCHTNLAALLDWPDLDSDEEVCMCVSFSYSCLLVTHPAGCSLMERVQISVNKFWVGLRPVRHYTPGQ